MSYATQRKRADITIRACRAMLRTVAIASLIAAAACGSSGGPAQSVGLAETNDLPPPGVASAPSAVIDLASE